MPPEDGYTQEGTSTNLAKAFLTKQNKLKRNKTKQNMPLPMPMSGCPLSCLCPQTFLCSAPALEVLTAILQRLPYAESQHVFTALSQLLASPGFCLAVATHEGISAALCAAMRAAPDGVKAMAVQALVRVAEHGCTALPLWRDHDVAGAVLRAVSDTDSDTLKKGCLELLALVTASERLRPLLMELGQDTVVKAVCKHVLHSAEEIQVPGCTWVAP